ncbi:MAG: hypothetical protein DA330_09245 [Nitrososphaera sp.]|nr:hypothetical protein [Nitrososphaera sp.]
MAVDMKPYAGFELGKSFNREALVADQTTIEQALTAAKQKQTQEKQEAQRNTEQINQNTNQIQGIERTLPDQQRRLTAL